MTTSFDPSTAHDMEAVASRNWMASSEYATKVAAEAIEDACDHGGCAERIDGYERNRVSSSHEEIM